MTDQTDTEHEAAARADLITFLRSTTTTRVHREADGDTEVSVEHTARFAIEPGAVDDLPHKYGKQIFRPLWLTAIWHRGELSRIAVSGPRVLASGKMAEIGEHNRNANTRDFEWSGRYEIRRGIGYKGQELPAIIVKRLADYEIAVAMTRAGGVK